MILENNELQQAVPADLDEKLFKLLVSSVKDHAIFMVSPAGYVMSWNEGATEIKGYSETEIIGKHLSLFYLPEDIAANEPERNLAEALVHGSFETEGWRIKKNGNKFWANVVFTALYDEQGQHIGFGKVTRNITQYKIREGKNEIMKAELQADVKAQTAKIIASELRFRKLIENSAEGISLLDDNFRVFYRSRSAERINGWGDAERAAYTNADLVHPDDMLIVQDMMERVISNPQQPVSISIRSKHRSGKYMWLECLYTNMLADPHVHAIVCNFRDITERKKAEEEAQKKADQIEQILGRITDGFIALDSQMRYTYINKQAAVMVNRDPATMMGKYIWKVFPDAVGSKTYNAIMEAYRQQRYITNEDHYPPLKLWQENHIYPSAEGISMFIRDISDRKLAQQQVQQQNAQLNEASATQAAVLNALLPYIALIDTDGKILTVNRAWKELFDASHSATPNYGIGISYFKITTRIPGVTRAFIKTIEKGIRSVISGAEKSFITEFSFHTHSGLRWFQLMAAPLSDHKYKGAVVAHTDITERKLAEGSLLRSETELRSVFENTSLCIMLLDNDLKVRSFNNNARQLAIKSFQKPLEKGTPVFEYFPPERKEAIQQSIAVARSGQLVQYEVFYEFPGCDSEWYEVKWVNIEDDQKHAMGIILTVDNITTRKSHEAEIRRQNEALKHVAWIGSHEIRRPVASIMGLMYLFKLSDDSNEKEELMVMIERCAEELNHLVLTIHEKINEDLIYPAEHKEE